MAWHSGFCTVIPYKIVPQVHESIYICYHSIVTLHLIRNMRRECLIIEGVHTWRLLNINMRVSWRDQRKEYAYGDLVIQKVEKEEKKPNRGG